MRVLFWTNTGIAAINAASAAANLAFFARGYTLNGAVGFLNLLIMGFALGFAWEIREYR